jgi:protoporphyrinogen oxidase
MGVSIVLGAEVQRITPVETNRVEIGLNGGRTETFDRIVLTVPSPIAARLCPGLSEEESSRLSDVDYQGLVCASLLLDRPLTDYYITNITEPWVPFTAVIELTAFVDRRTFGGKSLVYLPKYLSSNDPQFDASDSEWEDRFLEALVRMHPSFEREQVLACRISRERLVYALPTLGYSERRPHTRSTLPGVFFVNSSQIVNGTLNVNETIKLADEAVSDLLADGNIAPTPPAAGNGH